jgi:methionyl-tRNA synthetase
MAAEIELRVSLEEAYRLVSLLDSYINEQDDWYAADDDSDKEDIEEQASILAHMIVQKLTDLRRGRGPGTMFVKNPESR